MGSVERVILESLDSVMEEGLMGEHKHDEFVDYWMKCGIDFGYWKDIFWNLDVQ